MNSQLEKLNPRLLYATTNPSNQPYVPYTESIDWKNIGPNFTTNIFLPIVV